MMKECSKCKEVKPYSDFGKDKSKKDGFLSSCKYCQKQHYQENKVKIKQRQKQYYEENKKKISQSQKQYYEENKEKLNQCKKQYYEENKKKISQSQKQYYEENKEKLNQWNKQYYQENKNKIKQRQKQYYQENKKKLNQWNKQYYQENKEKLNQLTKQYYQENKEKINQLTNQYRKENKEKLNQYFKQRRKTDPIFRLSGNTRNLIRLSLKNKSYSKNTNTHKILGLEYEEFYTWLNTEASNGLDFDKDDVHVDHVIPVSFGKTEEQVLALNHYSNLQLLTSEENLNKYNTYIKQSNLDRVMKHHPNNSLLTKILLNYDYIIF